MATYSTTELIAAAQLIADKDYTVRQAAKTMSIPKSTLHKYCVTRLCVDDPALFHRVEGKLSVHLATRHINGGEATKKVWEAKKDSNE